MHSIENEHLKIVVSSHGAELQSIINKANDREYLWQGDARWWGRRSPVLFPIVGKLANNTYYVKGREYHLPQHGFARDMEFELVEATEDKLKYVLTANGLTMAQYPYDFKLTISYKLIDNKVSVKYKVYNNGSELMYFSIGGHPAFNTNLTEKGLEDYYLDFYQEKTLKSKVVDHQVGLLTRQEKLVVDQASTLDLTYKHFDEDALIFEGIHKVALKNRINDQEVIYESNDFPLLGIWTSRAEPNCPFLCIEPWIGVADYVGKPKDIVDKPYIESVLPNNKYCALYTLEIK